MHRRRIGIVIALALLAATAISAFGRLTYIRGAWGVSLIGGSIVVKRVPPHVWPTTGLDWQPYDGPPTLALSGPSATRTPGGMLDATLPLWLPLAALVTLMTANRLRSRFVLRRAEKVQFRRDNPATLG